MCQPKGEYHPQSDCLLGFCGLVCAKGHHLVTKCKCEDRHQCDVSGDGGVVLGESLDNDSRVYDLIVETFKKRKVATSGRAMLIVPHHPDLPRLCVVWAPVCNAFSAKNYVVPQWEEVDGLLKTHFEPIGLFQTGKASDGAATRRKPQLEQMSSTDGERYGIKIAGFTQTGLVTDRTADTIIVKHVHDQDYLRVAKRMLGSCDRSNRELQVGKHVAHMYAIKYMTEECDASEHGLWRSDGTRRGKNAMDWSSVVRILSTPAMNCMERLAADPRHGVQVAGMMWFLRFLRVYVGLFADQTLTPLQRVGGAWYVITTLRCWRLWIIKTKGYKLTTNFLTSETFQDAITSCFCLILTIMAIRDMTG
jgi:hypothetical protein